MGVVKTGVSAFGKLLTVIALAGTFIVGMVGVVYMSLRGEEVKIPEVVGKDFKESEKELEAMGLRIKRVAGKYSEEKPDTILEQRPRAGEAGKTGLMISVVVAEASSDGKEAPATIQKDNPEEAETTTDLEIPSDKTKKSNKNANVKKAATTRDVPSNKNNKNSNTSSSANSNKTDTAASNSANKSDSANSNGTQPSPKPSVKPSVVPLQTPKPTPAKTPVSGGDLRSRRAPQDN